MPFRMPPPSQFASSPSTPTSPVSRPSTSQPLAHQATLRLPAPPLPPKPLHLTISRNSTLLSDQHHQEVSREDGEGTVRQERSKGNEGGRGRRGEMPRWSNYGQDESEGDQARDQEYGTIKGISTSDREEEEAEEVVEARKIIEGEMERRTIKEEEEEPTMSQLLSTTSIRRRKEGRSDLSSNQSYKSASATLRVGGIEEGQGTIKRKSIYFDPRKENPLLPPELDVDVNKDQDLSGEEQREKEENQDRILLNSDEPTRSISSNPDPPRPLPSDSPQLDLPPNPLLAISLHPFTGESSFGELSFEGGIELCIEVEDLGGGWSLGYLRSVGEDGRGLVPRGWYAYVDSTTECTSSTSVEAIKVSERRVSTNSTTEEPPSPFLDETPISPLAARAQSPLPSSDSSPSSPSPVPVPLPVFSPSSDQAEVPLSHPPLELSSTSPPIQQEELESPPISPGSYATRSIGRHLVISGTEFEPIELESAKGEEVLERESEAIGRDRAGAIDEGKKGLGGLVEGEETEKSSQGGSINADDEETSFSRQTEQEPSDQLLNRTESTQTAEESALNSPPHRCLSETTPSTASTTSHPPLSTRSRPAAQSSSSILYRLGLASAPSAPPTASYLLGGLSIPGASILAHSHKRHSILAKKERLSRHLGVMSGKGYVMEWIKKGDEFDEEIGEDTQTWDIDEGPAWRSTSEPLIIQTHSPRKLSPLGENPYTSFKLTTYFPSTSSLDPSPEPLTVSRRYSHFVILHQLLTARFSLLSIPPLPPKAYGATRFSEEFVEERRRALERWLGKVGRHPVLRETEEVRGFLSFREEKDLRQLLSTSSTSVTPLFFARVFHPEFNIDVNEAEDIGQRFERHVKAIETGGGVRNVETAVQKHREGLRDNAISLRSLATSLSRLVAGLTLPPTSHDPPKSAEETGTAAHENEVAQIARRAMEWRVQNELGALSWREGDDHALSLSKAVQASAEALASVADSVHETARNDLPAAQLILQELSQPATQHASLLANYKQALAEYRRLNRLSTNERADQVEQLSRCETILNITCAEMDYIRAERTEDLQEAVRMLLDAEIALQEQSLEQLRFARGHFDEEAFPLLSLSGPRLRSTLERPATLPLYPPLPSVRSFMSPRTTALTMTGVIGSTLLRRGSTQTSLNVAREREESIDEREEEEGEREEVEESATRGTWRESVLGTVRIW